MNNDLEKTRDELNECIVSKHNKLTSKKIIKLSQRLDRHIVEAQKAKLVITKAR